MSADKKPGLLLDRDGVVIEDTHHLHDPEQVRLIPGSAEAIARINAAGLPVVLVSNQAGIGRGIYREADYQAVQVRLARLLAAQGAHVDASYHCPHHPVFGIGSYRIKCGCRKPNPGMLRQAAADLNLDLGHSVMVGDKLSDLEAGRAAGCRTILVRSGYGAESEQEINRSSRLDLVDGVFDSLIEAHRAILSWLEHP